MTPSPRMDELTAEQIERAISDPESSVEWTDEQWRTLCRMALRSLQVGVPREPTKAMCDAASRWFFMYSRTPPSHKSATIAEAYKAMLRAAGVTNE